MKVKVTKKEIMNNYKNIICIGYCNIQWLLQYKNANYYTCGVYGWNSDIYTIGNIVICTGYRPFGNIRVDYKIQQKYDNMANKICCSDLKYETKVKKVNKLLEKFINEVMKEV